MPVGGVNFPCRLTIWEASDRICGKRLRPLAPILIEAMERHGHLQLAPEVRAGLEAMSAATSGRALARAPKCSCKTCHIRRMDSRSVGILIPSIDCDGGTLDPGEH